MAQHFTDVQINVDLNKWMAKVTDKNDQRVAYVVGRVVGGHNILAVSEDRTGITRYYCQTHQRIYPFNKPCPECAETSTTN